MTGPAPDRLAEIEGRLADAAFQLPRPEHASSVGMATIRMHADLAALVAAVKVVREIHRPHPDGGNGYDATGAYVWFDQVCQTCGQFDEYAVPYPCPTARALEAM